MARERPYIFSLNGGEVSGLSMGRVDLQRMRISCGEMLNCLPRVIGPMSFRPGLGHKTSTKSDAAAKMIPFIYSASDTAMIELTDQVMRVLIAGTPISRASVSTVVTNGDFSSGTGWTLTTTGDAVATISSNVLTLQTLPKGSTTLAKRSDSVSGGDQNTEHAIEITVAKGPVKFRCGSTDGGQEYIGELALETGFHSIAFTPTSGTYYIQFSVESEAPRIVSNVVIASSGDVEIVTPWLEADLDSLRHAQSADVIFVTSSEGTYQQRKIIRTLGTSSTTSWSLVKHEFKDGPLLGKTADLTLTPSSRTGSGTLTASKPFFDAGHVDAIFRLTHPTSYVNNLVQGNDQYTDPVEVSGAYTFANGSQSQQRKVTLTIANGSSGWTGGGAGVSLQVSDDDGGSWQTAETWVNNVAGGIRWPGTENVTVLFRMGFSPGDYVTGQADITIDYDGQGGEGFIVITSVTNSTTAEYYVITPLSEAAETKDWSEGKYSGFRGWPTAVGLTEGRLWLGDKDKINGTVSDGFNSFDLEQEGDSGPIIRSIATGPVNKVQWILGLQRLLIGTSGAEVVGKSSSFDEHVTPTNFNLKDASTQGSANVQAVKVDKSGAFVQRSGKKLFDIFHSVEAQDYTSSDLTRYHPTILSAGVKTLAVQRQPDTRIWVVLDDGTAACIVYERAEDVVSWFRVETDGTIEDIEVLPNTTDDDIYFVVQRTINSLTKRYVEVLAYESNAQGGDDNYMADSYKTVTLAASTTVTGAGHLEGESVVVWADGAAIMDGDEPKTFTVSGGTFELDDAVTGDVTYGLSYTGKWKSAKLAYGVADQSPISRKKIIREVAPLLYKTHIRGLQYGHNYDTMDYLPLLYKMEEKATTHVFDEYDQEEMPLDGDWDTDSRLHLKMQAPLPCTVLALSLVVEGH